MKKKRYYELMTFSRRNNGDTDFESSKQCHGRLLLSCWG